MVSGYFLVRGMDISFPRATVNVFCFLSLEHTFFFFLFCLHHRDFGHSLLTGLIVITIYVWGFFFIFIKIPFQFFDSPLLKDFLKKYLTYH